MTYMIPVQLQGQRAKGQTSKWHRGAELLHRQPSGECRVSEIANLCERSGKQLVIYISMAFGNPYGDPWSMEILQEGIRTLIKSGIRVIPLSNVAIEIDRELIKEVFTLVIPEFPSVEFGLH